MNSVKLNETLNNVPYLLIQNAVRNISFRSKMSVLLLITLYFSGYRMERCQKVQIWTSQKPKKETRLKTRVNSCTRSHQEKKSKRKTRVLKKRLNFQLRVQTKIRTTSVNVLETR